MRLRNRSRKREVARRRLRIAAALLEKVAGNNLDALLLQIVASVIVQLTMLNVN